MKSMNEKLSSNLQLSNSEIAEINQWHSNQKFILINELNAVIEELAFHTELQSEKKVALLTNREYLMSYPIRQEGLKTIPAEWINPKTLEIDNEKLYKIWLQASKGYLHQMLSRSNALEKSNSFKYRGNFKTQEERKAERLEKLQKSITRNQVAIFLGRQNMAYKSLQNQLNIQYKSSLQFISDHVWSSCGYIEPGVKISDSRLSVLQAMESIRLLPELGLQGDAIERREIAFCLDGYDEKHALSAIYSTPNIIKRNYKKPDIEGISKFEFSYTGLTDLELSNIVRNKNWFDLLAFYRTTRNGTFEKLTKKQVAEEYGIKYLGHLIQKRIEPKI